MAVSGEMLIKELRQLASDLRAAPRSERGSVDVADDAVERLALYYDVAVKEIDGLRAELDLLGAGCATVIRCGETIRIIGPDGHGVFATINARMQEGGAGSPPDVGRVQRAARKMQMAAREFCGHAVKAAGKGGLHEDVVRVPLGAWSEWEAAARAVEEGA